MLPDIEKLLDREELEAELERVTRERDNLRHELQSSIAHLPRLRQMVEHSTDMMLLIDDAGTIVDCNRAATTELGRERDGLYGVEFASIWNGDTASLHSAVEQAVPGQYSALTGDFVHTGGTTLPVEAHIAAFVADESRFRVVVARNIRERRRLELALRDIQEQLAIVKEQRELHQELRDVDRLEALARIASGIAHDFNNIFTCVRANVEMMPELDGDEQREARHDALEAVHQASRMARQLLTFSRGGTVVRKPVESSGWLRDASELAMSASVHALSLHLDSALPVVEVDEGQMTQVLHNLLQNAQEAMPSPGTVTLRATRGPMPSRHGEALVITVEDQGPGIPPDVASKIFDPFFTTKDAGNGIGLATSRRIVEEHGGTLRAIFGAGHGAFEVTLPMAEHGHTLASECTPICTAPPRIDGLRVLLMDDEQSVRSAMARTLRRAGAQVEECATGEEAIEKVRAAEQSFDVAILDLVIRNGMGGVETLSELHRHAPELRAILCSGGSDDVLAERFRSLGFHRFVAKPFSASELLSAVASLGTHTNE